MARIRRRIKSNKCYEICIRARKGLPFVAYKVINLIISSTLARVQRDDKLTLCHDLWNGSHGHILAVSKDSHQLVKFYGELQKKITDILKRLLGIEHLQIWEGRPTVIEIADLDAAAERIAYFYANPAQDNLVETIEQFPGYSSWSDFKDTLQLLDGQTKHTCPWIRLPSIPRLSRTILSPAEDAALVCALNARNSDKKHDLIRNPNAWMRCFGVSSDIEALEINNRILGKIEEKEKNARDKRTAEKKCIMGARKLCSQPIMKHHIPKKRERAIFVISSIKELRLDIIEDFKDFCNDCRRCYKMLLAGDVSVQWPPGAFKPPIPPNMNIVFS